MRHFTLIRLLLSLLLLVITPAEAKQPRDAHPATPSAQSAKIPLTLERVIDGDTLIASGRKIRIWGIDAPERGTPLFKLSTMLLETLLKDEDLSCIPIDMDRYKRHVMMCFAGKDDIASIMVQMGMARDFVKYSKGYYQAEEDIAKSRQTGIWASQ